MAEGGLELVDLDPLVEQRLELRVAGVADDRAVGDRARDHQAHAHVALDGVGEEVDQLVVGDEIGVLDDQVLAGAGDRQLVDHLHLGDAAARSAPHHVRPHRAGGGLRREVALPHQHLRGLVDPVLGEHRLHAVDDRPHQADAGVAPVILVLAVAGPLLGDAVAEDVGDAAVEDRQLAVGAVVVEADLAQPRRAVERDLDPRLLHAVEQLALGAVGAQGVEGDPHLDPVPRLVGERRRQAVADLPLPPDVGLEVDAAAAPARRRRRRRGRTGRRSGGPGRRCPAGWAELARLAIDGSACSKFVDVRHPHVRRVLLVGRPEEDDEDGHGEDGEARLRAR